MEVISQDENTKTIRISEGEALILAAAVGYVYSEFDALDTVRLEAGGASEQALEKIANDLYKVIGVADSKDANG